MTPQLQRFLFYIRYFSFDITQSTRNHPVISREAKRLVHKASRPLPFECLSNTGSFPGDSSSGKALCRNDSRCVKRWGDLEMCKVMIDNITAGQDYKLRRACASIRNPVVISREAKRRDIPSKQPIHHPYIPYIPYTLYFQYALKTSF